MRIDRILLGLLIAVSLSTAAYLLQLPESKYQFVLLPSLLFLTTFSSYSFFHGYKPLSNQEWLLWSALIVVSLGMVALLISQEETHVVFETDSSFIVGGLVLCSYLVALSSYLLHQTFSSTRMPKFQVLRRKGSKTIRVSSLKSSIIPNIMTRLQSRKSFRRLANWMAESIENNVIRSGLIESPSFLAQKYLSAATLSIPLALVAGIIVAIYVNPLGCC